MRALLKQKTINGFGLLAFFAVIIFMASALSVEAGPATKTIYNSKAQQDAALKYWTRDKIAAAPVLQMPVDFGDPGVDAAAMAEEALIGPEGSSPPGMSAPGAIQAARTTFAEDWEAIENEAMNAVSSYAAEASEAFSEDEAADLETGTASVYTYYDVGTQSAFYNIYPHKWDGKLTFTTPSGGASCSATVISNNHIVTAAHCVYDTTLNRWYGNWVFTPAFRNGTAPYGTFTALNATVLTAWINLSGSYSINGWARYDVALIKLRPQSTGRTINQAVGWAGRIWNASSNQLVFNSGYPGKTYTDASISNGPAQYLRACVAESFLQTTDTLGSGCYWGRGISGGSWLLSYKPFALSGQVNSVNSGLFIGSPNLYGAKFTSNNIVPLCNASGC